MTIATQIPSKNSGTGNRPKLGFPTPVWQVIKLKKGEHVFFNPLRLQPIGEVSPTLEKPTEDQPVIKILSQTRKDPPKSKTLRRKKPRRVPSKLPPRIKYPKWWKNLLPSGIRLTGPGSQVVVRGSPGFRSFITTIVFTVSGETLVTLTFGNLGSSGPMNFGGTDEPKGISIPMADAPAPIGSGSFIVSSTGDGVNVNGFVIYYSEPEEVPS